MQLGDKVRHRDRSDIGFGEVTAVYADGHLDVSFPSCSFTWVPADAFISAEAELREARRAEVKRRILDLLHRGEFEQAERVFVQEGCSAWWAAEDYERDRRQAVVAFRAKREAEEQARKRDLAINEVVCSYPNCSLQHLNQLLSDERLGLSSTEIAVLKLPKLNVRLARLGMSLDQEQRLACARPERKLLVRARAGSGKTRTLAAIAALAVGDEKLDPDQVMILAFNKKAAEEIGSRVREVTGVADYRNARTFHSLAYRLADHQDRKLVFDDGNLQLSRRKQSQFVERIVHAVLNPAFREKLYDFFRRELEQIERIGSNLKGEEYLVFRRAMTDYSLGGDSVKSNGEKFIADFLFEHGINYEYEKVWSWKKEDHLSGAPYRPDFSLLASGRDLIWEHWGIDPDDPAAAVPKWWKIDTDGYREQIEAKRRYWKRRGIPLIETHAAMLRDGRTAFEEQLANVLREHGIVCRKLSHAELVRRVAEAPRTISRMTELFRGFISRAKNRGWSVEQVAGVIAKSSDSEPRNRVFHELSVRAYAEYQELLGQEKSWDFDDMLISAAEQVRKRGDLAEIGLGRRESVKLRNLRYILIDEFQDFSELYYRLIRAIIDVNPEIRVIAVGDDWQAINGFAGAQLSFFENFREHFDGAGITDIATNYRSALDIVVAGNKVMGGRGQAARAKPGAERGRIVCRYVRGVWVDGNDESGGLCLEAAKEVRSGGTDFHLAKVLKACADFIVGSLGERGGSRHLPNILVLARTGYAYGLKHQAFRDCLLHVLERLPDLEGVVGDIDLEVMTVHKSKGKQAATVIVLETTTEQFPKVHADNQLLGPFGVSIEDTLAEERRLFYVAATRAECRLLFLTEQGNESPFLTELGIREGDNCHLAGNAKRAGIPGIPGLRLGDVAQSIKDRLDVEIGGGLREGL